MSQASQQIVARYHLRLSDAWRQWFDQDVTRVRLPGGFRTPLTAEQLVSQAPSQIWAGFMLPDTLPLVGNQYGDWICVRVESDGSLGEILHWYHGGGDWIPLGSDMAEVVVHDVVDHFRPVAGQMLRGAPESIDPQQRAGILAAFAEPSLRSWLSERLSARMQDQPSAMPKVTQALTAIEEAVRQGEYVSALQHMVDMGWAKDAVACDRIQHALQHVLRQANVNLADPEIARSLDMKWVPDYVRWLFDLSQVPPDARSRIADLTGAQTELWQQQDWTLAGELACEVLSRRRDLGWAINVAGWSRQRTGDAAGAAEIYFQGRHASAFSDQAVRMRTHWTDARYGKFTIAQLSQQLDLLTPAQQSDGYLRAIGTSTARLTIKQVQGFWLKESRQQFEQRAFGQAYEHMYRAGWDVGVDNLGDYQTILEELVTSARSAGWEARQAVAQTHLNCLLAAQAR
jgi:hypothetical protein